MSLPGNYGPTMTEQAVFNAFFQLRYWQLLRIYDVNLAMYTPRTQIFGTSTSTAAWLSKRN